MFGSLKDRLKNALGRFSKKVEEEGIEEKVEVEVTEESKKKKVKVKKEKKKEIKEEKVEGEVVEKSEEIVKGVVEEKEEISGDKVQIVYFVHGTTPDNEKKIFSTQSKIGLSELGEKQSIELKDQIKGDFDAIFSSDLKRAIDSAKLTWPDKKIIKDRRLRECDTGDLGSIEDRELEKYNEENDTINESFPNGESFKDVEERIRDFLNDTYKKYKGKRVAIVAHKYTQLAIEVLLNGKTWEQAIEEDWRLKDPKEWKPGWDYKIGALLEKEVEEKQSFFQKFKKSVTTKKINENQFDEFFYELELAMLENNVAIEVIDKIKESLKMDLVDVAIDKKEIDKIVGKSLKKSLEEIFDVEKIDLLKRIEEKDGVFLIVFVGVNGSGKTTTIAKIANMLKEKKISCVLAAADTFRAAAIMQLEEHGKKLGIKVIKHDYGSDPAAVIFDAVKHAKAKGIKVVLADTAGRQQSNVNLVEEMKKITRVNNPDLKIFVGESITGNDATIQAKSFNESIGIDAIILTKTDVDDKGGAIVSVGFVTGKPIIYLGCGQDHKDLKEFNPEDILKKLGL